WRLGVLRRRHGGLRIHVLLSVCVLLDLCVSDFGALLHLGHGFAVRCLGLSGGLSLPSALPVRPPLVSPRLLVPAFLAVRRAQKPVVPDQSQRRAVLVEHGPDPEVENPGDQDGGRSEIPFHDLPLSPSAVLLTPAMSTAF